MNPLERDNLTLTHRGLLHAGFTLESELPSGTRYESGDLYMRLGHSGTVRLYLPHGTDQIEISSGSIYHPIVHYTGPVLDVPQLLRFIEGYVLGPEA